MSESKYCRGCQTEKSVGEFSRHKDGLQSRCKACNRAYRKAHYDQQKEHARYLAKRAKDPEAYRARERAYREANREKMREYYRKWKERHPGREAELGRKSRSKPANKERERARKKRYRAANRERIRKTDQEWYQANREKVLAKQKAYWVENADQIRTRERARYRANPEKALSATRRWQLNNADKARLCRQVNHANRRGNPAQDLTTEQLKQILESTNRTCLYCGAATGKLDFDHFWPVKKGGSGEAWNIVPSCRDCNRGRGGKHNRDPEEWVRSRFGDEAWARIQTYMREHGRVHGKPV